MSKFTKGEWTYREYVPEGVTLNGVEYLVCSDKGEEIALVRNEADAKLIAYAKQMYEEMQDTMHTINSILPYIPDELDDLHLQYDKNSLQVEADLIDDLLTLIDGEEAQS